MAEHNHILAPLPADQRAAVEAAAVLETFDAAALAALVDAPVEGALAALIAAGMLRAAGGEYTLADELQAAALDALAADPPRLRELYRRAATHYAERLAVANTPVHPGGKPFPVLTTDDRRQTTAPSSIVGRLSSAKPDTDFEKAALERAKIERAYMRHLERRCEALVQQEPTALAAEAAAAPLELLTEPAHRHLLRYYRGLGEGLLDHFDVARAAFDALLAEPDLDDAVRGRVLNAAAIFARRQGDYERAREGYRASYAIWERLGNRQRQGLALMNRGLLSYMLQDYLAARRDLLASLELFRAVGAAHSQALALMNLGVLARDEGRWDDALAYSREAAALFESAGARDFLGRVANNIGEVEMLRGRLDAALTQFERALAQMTTRVYGVDVEINLGLVAQARGGDLGALAHYRAALDTALAIERREVVALIHYRIGHAAQRLGDLDAAQASYAAAVESIEASRAPVRDEGLLISLMGRWQQVYEAAALLCLTRGDAAGAFDYAERARARAFADMLARRGSGLDHARLAPVSADEAQAALPPGTLLLAYFAAGLRGPETALLDAIPPEAAGLRACLATEPRLLLLALTRDGPRAHVCPIDPNALQASSPYMADGQRFLAPAILRRAHAALIDPVADLVEQAARVVVVPHGPLHMLPFAALLDATGRSLIERAPALAFAPSATVLLQGVLEKRAETQKTCLALGYDGAAGRRLRHTEAEAAAVARICGGEAWRGDRGMAARLERAAGGARWLHLACHGQFDLDEPLRSWLEIGPDERLSATDVLTHFALGCDLVALSACRSGVSRVLRGDEPMGLVRAFLSAGARTVLVTLWPVEDTSARLLMERFYREMLDQGPRADPATALRAAQRHLRDLTVADLRAVMDGWGETDAALPPNPDARPYADPAFWAAYVLVTGGRQEIGDRR